MTSSLTVVCAHPNEYSPPYVFDRASKYVWKLMENFFQMNDRFAKLEQQIWEPGDIWGNEKSFSVRLTGNDSRHFYVGQVVHEELNDLMLNAYNWNRLGELSSLAPQLGRTIVAKGQYGQTELRVRLMNKTLADYVVKGQPEPPRENEFLIYNSREWQAEWVYDRWIEFRDARVAEASPLMVYDIPRPQ